jgi:hypothetical protein
VRLDVTQKTSLVEGVLTLPLLSHISPVLSNRLVLSPYGYKLALEGANWYLGSALV